MVLSWTRICQLACIPFCILQDLLLTFFLLVVKFSFICLPRNGPCHEALESLNFKMICMEISWPPL
uniref:Protein DEFECTIVE IN MERISTEM SILENCING 3 n=1 Tax=Rhizophora mucronata TaxID=61149 RepID=A0A2P2KHU2_RHIMU